ncbi:MAG: transglycosylase SLT domain-containing protein [Holosporales bacterium]|jgi:hypothetical protein|nr:transglycosylase SLT domain-containing protein [Holosporales bacterium]
MSATTEPDIFILTLQINFRKKLKRILTAVVFCCPCFSHKSLLSLSNESYTEKINKYLTTGDFTSFYKILKKIPDSNRIKIARELIAQKSFSEAYQVLSSHRVKKTQPLYIEIEWLCGFLCLCRLNDVPQAVYHFSNMVNNVTTLNQKSKAAFWLAIAYQKQQNISDSLFWLSVASQFSATYYGQITQIYLQRTFSKSPERINHQTPFGSSNSRDGVTNRFASWLQALTQEENRVDLNQAAIEATNGGPAMPPVGVFAQPVESSSGAPFTQPRGLFMPPVGSSQFTAPFVQPVGPLIQPVAPLMNSVPPPLVVSAAPPMSSPQSMPPLTIPPPRIPPSTLPPMPQGLFPPPGMLPPPGILLAPSPVYLPPGSLPVLSYNAPQLAPNGKFVLTSDTLNKIVSNVDPCMILRVYNNFLVDYKSPRVTAYPLLEKFVYKDYLNVLYSAGDLRKLNASAPTSSKFMEALTHAITLNESSFNRRAKSTAGAQGMMQLMPKTARGEFNKFVKKNLVSAKNSFNIYSALDNLILGISHLKELINEFGPNIVLIASAYNAGVKNVRKWIQTYGDPRTDAISLLEWVELIPFKETRLYVQHVIAAFAVYTCLLNAEYLQDFVWPSFQ